MQTNFLIIGSGISGLNFALHAAKKGKVTIVTKKKIIDSSTNFAQGGIAAVLDKTDNVKAHTRDTMECGNFHNKKKAVEFMIKKSPAAIYRLIELGVEFEKEKGELKLTKEGGHNKRRIAYVGDYTGKEIERILVKRVKENPNINILEDTFALDLITKGRACFGCRIIRKNKLEEIFADQTILATGGLGQLFSHTTNPPIATGDGIAMGIRAGCKVRDLEFIQFHPTALAKKVSPRFLISETVRGEGAKLVNSKGEKFMKNKHPLKDLAPRNIVAKEIYRELKNGPVYLDITHKNRDYLEKRFPQIYTQLKKYGYDMAKDLIPVIPVAHYECGGIVTDLHGKTGIKNLFAFGEVTCTGVHGANRLASNSLLEALVFSNQVADFLSARIKNPSIKINGAKFLSKNELRIKILLKNSPQTKMANSLRKEIQDLMWKYAGIIRDRKLIKKEGIPKLLAIQKKFSKIKGTNQKIAEAKNMAEVGLLILKAAQKRHHSLGCHYVE